MERPAVVPRAGRIFFERERAAAASGGGAAEGLLPGGRGGPPRALRGWGASHRIRMSDVVYLRQRTVILRERFLLTNKKSRLFSLLSYSDWKKKENIFTKEGWEDGLDTNAATAKECFFATAS